MSQPAGPDDRPERSGAGPGAGEGEEDGPPASAEAGQLLTILAFLGSGPVPLWLFAEGSAHLPSPLEAAAAAGTGPLERTAAELVERGLARLEGGSVALDLEAAAARREALSGVQRAREAATALTLLDHAFPERVGRQEDVARSEALAPAIEAAAGHVSGGGRATARATHLLARLGSFRALSGHPEDARRALRRAVELAEGEEGGGPLEGPLRAVLADELAAVLVELERPEEAAHQARRARELAHEALPPDAPQLPVFLLNIGRTLRQAGDPEGAEAALREALEKAEGADSPAAGPLVLEARLALAELALDQDRPEDARRAAREALETVDQDRAPELAARAAWILADALGEAGRPEEATGLYRRSLELDVRRYGHDHPGVGQKALGLGLHLERLGLGAEAREAYERALDIFDRTLGSDSEAARAARTCLERVRS